MLNVDNKVKFSLKEITNSFKIADTNVYKILMFIMILYILIQKWLKCLMIYSRKYKIILVIIIILNEIVYIIILI